MSLGKLTTKVRVQVLIEVTGEEYVWGEGTSVQSLHREATNKATRTVLSALQGASLKDAEILETKVTTLTTEQQEAEPFKEATP